MQAIACERLEVPDSVRNLAERRGNVESVRHRPLGVKLCVEVDDVLVRAVDQVTDSLVQGRFKVALAKRREVIHRPARTGSVVT